MSFLDVGFLISFMQNYGYIAIFVLMLGESIILPLPNEIVLVFTGALVAGGIINPFLAYAVVVTSGLVSNWIDYAIGYLFGFKFIFKYGSKLGYKMKDYQLGIKWINRYGNYFAFITKVLPVVRVVSGLICGAFKMDKKRFTLYTLAGLMIWSAVLMYLGYTVTSNWQSIADAIIGSGAYIWIAAIVIFLILVRKQIRTLGKSLYRIIAK